MVVQYLDWAGGALQGDLGTSLTSQVPAWDLLGPALSNSFKLALRRLRPLRPALDPRRRDLRAALRQGAPTASITIAGISFAAMPDFVTGIFLILVFGIWLGWLPVTAQWEDGASLPTQLQHLLLPALTLTIVLFGYIARITRAGMIEALDSDYARTAYLKGLPSGVVVRRHVLRNALLPDDRRRRRPDRVPLRRASSPSSSSSTTAGSALLILDAAKAKDLPLLTSGVLVIGTSTSSSR